MFVFCNSRCWRFGHLIPHIPWQVFYNLYGLPNAFGEFQRLAHRIIYNFHFFHHVLHVFFSPFHPCCLDAFQGEDVLDCNMVDYHRNGRQKSLLELVRNTTRTLFDVLMGFFHPAKIHHTQYIFVLLATPNTHSFPFYQPLTRSDLYLFGSWLSNKNYHPCQNSYAGMGGTREYLLGGEIGGDVAGDGLLLFKRGRAFQGDQKSNFFAEIGQFFGWNLGKFLHDLVKNRHGGTPFYRLIRRALIQYCQPSVVVMSRRWVRLGRVFHHSIGPSLFALLGGSFLRHLLDFVMSIGSILQVEVNRTQYFSIQGSAIILCRLFDRFMRVVVHPKCNFYHDPIVVASSHFVKTGELA